jgi:alpha-beta hydrolase superfamily lysophospholipase
MPLRSPPRLVAFAIRTVLLLLSLAALAWVGLLMLLYWQQERLIFPASRLPDNHRFQFAQPFTELRIPVPGATLSALHFTQPSPRGLVFFLHGNAGNLQTWTTGLDFYRAANFDLFMLDYRGYGKSSGSITSETQLHADVRAAWDAIAPRYRGKPIVIYGRSLGTGLAARLAQDVHPQLVVLVTPYTSLAATARRAYPLAPDLLLKYPLRTDAIIGDVRSPILLLHGARDELIPVTDSVRLQALARSPAELVVVEAAGHNDIHLFPHYLERLAARLRIL